MIKHTLFVATLALACAVSSHAGNLRSGARGSEVKRVQTQLRLHGISVRGTGVYDAQTVAAVKAFQRKRSLPATGRVDDMTTAALERPMQSGDRGRTVRYVQSRLNTITPGLPVSGVFDSRTELALRHFQRTVDLPVTGQVDRTTLVELTRAANHNRAEAERDHGRREQRLIHEAQRVLEGNPQGFREDVFVVIDYGLHSSQPRFVVVDRTARTTTRFRVAHGMGSDPQNSGYARTFSNENNTQTPTKKTSVGVFRTAETYTSQRLGHALRLDGLSGTNSNSRARGLCVHASPSESSSRGPVARSWGGPALSQSVARDVIERIKGGALVYAPHPHGSATVDGQVTPTSTPESRLDVRPDGGRVNYRGRTVSSAQVRAVLQRIANLSERTVRVTSGDRNHVPTGGSRTSLHLHHRAADFTVVGLSLGETFELIRQNRSTLLPDGSYEVIWHQAGTNTGGPHLHIGFRTASGASQFKTERGGTYRRVN